MGKSLTGKELGQGISQRKDGRFQARFTNRFGKRQTIYGKTINEIRQKLRAEQYEDEKQINVVSSDMTLDEWFEIWMETCKNNCRDTTRQTYRVSYNRIKESLGWRKLSGLNLIVMQQAINELKSDASRKDTKKLLVDMLNKAVDSDLLHKNVAKQINTVVSKDSKPEEPRVLTIEETDLFLEAASHYRYFNAFSLALETGMRIGEIIGLKWSDIDFKKRILKVERSMEYRYKVGEWRVGEPKSKSGFRTIPLTAEAIRILKEQKRKNSNIDIISMEWADTVFLCRNGTPVKNSTYDSNLFKICDKAGIDRFSMHVLRHTFATRCIEAGMLPKTLQKIMGHSNIGITMNLYVHITEDEKQKEIDMVADALNVV